VILQIGTYRKKEPRSPAGFRFRPYFPFVQLYDLFAMGQADAGAFILIPGMEALENDEYPFQELALHADAVVADDELPMPVAGCRRDLYLWNAALLPEFDGVGDKVLEQQF
jgi:hypothetical protein